MECKGRVNNVENIRPERHTLRRASSEVSRRDLWYRIVEHLPRRLQTEPDDVAILEALYLSLEINARSTSHVEDAEVTIHPLPS